MGRLQLALRDWLDRLVQKCSASLLRMAEQHFPELLKEGSGVDDILNEHWMFSGMNLPDHDIADYKHELIRSRECNHPVYKVVAALQSFAHGHQLLCCCRPRVAMRCVC